MIRERHVIVMMASLALMCAAACALVNLLSVRIIAAVVLALVLPGYVTTAALFGTSRPALAFRVAIGIAISLAVLILGAVVLNALPGGLDRRSWSIYLAAVTLIGCVVWWYRTPDGPVLLRHFTGRVRSVGVLSWAAIALAVVLAVGSLVALRWELGGPWSIYLAAVTLIGCVVWWYRTPDGPVVLRHFTGRVRSVGFLSWAAIALAMVLAVGSLVASRWELGAPNAIGYTQLWIIPPTQRTGALRIGVESDQLRPARYRLVVRRGSARQAWQFALKPGQRKLLSLPAISDRQTMIARLRIAGRQGIYRQVRYIAP